MEKESINVQKFVEDTEETELRLHVRLRMWEEEFDQFSKKPIFKNRKKFEEAYRQYTYYQGKFYAYYHTLSKLGSDIPSVLQRLRGIGMTSANVWETKAHYTEIYGHFPTKWVLEQNKVKK